MSCTQTILCAAFSALAVLNGADSTAERLIGRWRSLETSKGGIGAMFEFRDGGVVVFSPGAVVEMQYRIEGGELVLPPATHGGPEQRIPITLSGKDHLALELSGGRPGIRSS